MGSLREAARDRDWRGGLGLAHSRLGSVQISSYDLSKFAAALTRLVALYARARRAATGRGAGELWGLCARPPAIGIGEGGLVSLTPGSARYKLRVMIYRNSPPRLPDLLPSTRARGAPPRVEPPVSYGVSARGRPRSGLARGAWSRSRQARLGTNCEL